jgi:DNA (cytosine-5)-methyltransferase 1
MWFTKAKRAQSDQDFETWIQGGVVPTLNAMDNNGEAFATVLIIDGTRVDDVRVYENGIVPTVISRWGTGGGNVPMIFSHTQGLDIQASETNSPTLRTGGAGMAVLAFDLYNQQVTEKNQTLSSAASDASHTGTIWEGSIVRRLTPTECERLQGFPDGWTDGQADSNRYKQMGNAVAVPVVQWIIDRMVADE